MKKKLQSMRRYGEADAERPHLGTGRMNPFWRDMYFAKKFGKVW